MILLNNILILSNQLLLLDFIIAYNLFIVLNNRHLLLELICVPVEDLLVLTHVVLVPIIIVLFLGQFLIIFNHLSRGASASFQVVLAHFLLSLPQWVRAVSDISWHFQRLLIEKIDFNFGNILYCTF